MAGGRGAARTNDRMVVDLTRQLGALLAELDLAEVEVSVGDVRVRLARASAPTAVPAAAPAPPGVSAVPSVAALATSLEGGRLAGLIPIEAPMVGTFYRASTPDGEPYVREGDLVKEGQILCIIEAMKLMNEIEAKVGGHVVKIFPENGQPVEYGQPLFLIDPTR